MQTNTHRSEQKEIEDYDEGQTEKERNLSRGGVGEERNKERPNRFGGKLKMVTLLHLHETVNLLDAYSP